MRRISVFAIRPIRGNCSAHREPLLATLSAFAALASTVSVLANPSADRVVELPAVEVTETRIPENVDKIPAHLTIIQGDELRARGVTDLRTALSLVAGVEAPPGGDTGPAGAVPSFWGLHEFDAFLLVVDGVPWGGAFNPSIPTLNLNDVERIEVLRGAAPVIFGATSFVGVIQVIHYPAGQAANQAVSDWQRKLAQVSVNDPVAYAKGLATELQGLVCASDANAIHILRGIIKFGRLAATGPEAPERVDFIKSEKCPVSTSLTDDDKAKLLQIKQDAEKNFPRTPASKKEK